MPQSQRSVSRVIQWVLLLCWLVLVLRVLWEHPNTSYGGRDGIKYVLLAQMSVDPEVQPPSPPQYPPGWPFLLAANFRLGGDIVTAHLLNFAMMTAGIGLVGFYWLPKTGPVPALAAVLAFAAHRTTLNLGDKLLSEPTFLVCLAATLIVVERCGASLRSPKVSLGVGLLAAACRCVRTAGISVVAGLAASYLIARDMKPTRRAACVLAVILPALVFELWLIGFHNSAAALPGGGYVGQLLERGGRSAGPDGIGAIELGVIQEHVLQHTKNLASVMIPLAPEFWWPGTLFKLLGILILLAAIVELIILLFTERSPTACIVILYLAVVYVWPYYSLRFFWPVVPFLWSFAYTFALRVASRADKNWAVSMPRSVGISFVVFAVLAFSCAMYRPSLGRENAQQQLEAYATALDWIDGHSGETPPRVASLSYYRMYLLRPNWHITPLAYQNTPDAQQSTLRQQNVQWIVETQARSDKYLSRLVERGVIREVHDASSVIVYEFLDSGSLME